MARTKLSIKETRNLTKLNRAISVASKLEDADDYFDAIETTVYSAAGAIAVTDGLSVLTATGVAQAMTLADGTVVGQQMALIMRSTTTGGSMVVTGTFTGGTTLTFDAVSERAKLIWVGAAWTPVPGYSATLA